MEYALHFTRHLLSVKDLVAVASGGKNRVACCSVIKLALTTSPKILVPSTTNIPRATIPTTIKTNQIKLRDSWKTCSHKFKIQQHVKHKKLFIATQIIATQLLNVYLYKLFKHKLNIDDWFAH